MLFQNNPLVYYFNKLDPFITVKPTRIYESSHLSFLSLGMFFRNHGLDHVLSKNTEKDIAEFCAMLYNNTESVVFFTHTKEIEDNVTSTEYCFGVLDKDNKVMFLFPESGFFFYSEGNREFHKAKMVPSRYDDFFEVAKHLKIYLNW